MERGEGEVWLTHFRALRKMTRECGRRRTGWVTGRDMSTIRSELRDLDTGGEGGGGGECLLRKHPDNQGRATVLGCILGMIQRSCIQGQEIR